MTTEPKSELDRLRAWEGRTEAELSRLKDDRDAVVKEITVKTLLLSRCKKMIAQLTMGEMKTV